MVNYLDELNTQQRMAVTATEGRVRLVAGAGSGKTRALAHRFAYLVNELGILPGNILCVTFTNQSANEMKQRIRTLTGDNDTGYISTFHSFCVSVLQEESYAVAYPKSFLVLDNADIDAMLKIIYEERELTLRHRTFSQARDMIEIEKTIRRPEYYQDMIEMSLESLKQKYLDAAAPDDIIFFGYLYQQKKCFGLDYNDLIKYTLHIFQENEAIRLKWQKRLAYIMIDEFQDIDELQYRLMSVLAGYHGNLFIVGDPDQTIYTWRGANVRYLMDFDSAFPGVNTIYMLQNYRSTPEILAVVNSLIAHNKERMKKDLIPMLPHGRKVVCHHALTSAKEAEWVAERIRELAEEGVGLGDIAVLYRAHYVTRALEEVFLARKLPYTIYSGVQFFDRAEVKDALSYLRLLIYRDDLSFARIINVPKRNIGQRRMEFLRSYGEQNGCSLYEALKRSLSDELFKNTAAAKFIDLVERYSACCGSMPISELMSELMDHSGYEEALRTQGSQERLDNLAELKQSIYAYETSCGEESTLENYLCHIALFTNADSGDRGNAVKLMTVHTAKGLEFPCVFLCAMEEGVFPSKKVTTIAGMEEERRLAFVAMTRAQKELYLSDAEGRNLDGSCRYPSRFLLDIDPGLLAFDQQWKKGLVREAEWFISGSEKLLSAAEAEPEFRQGDRVIHSVFGPGEVMELDRRQGAYLIRFDRLETPRRISFRTGLTRQ